MSPSITFSGQSAQNVFCVGSVNLMLQLQYNQGAAGAGCVLEEMGIENFGAHTARGLRALNDTRIKNTVNQS